MSSENKYGIVLTSEIELLSSREQLVEDYMNLCGYTENEARDALGEVIEEDYQF